MKKMLVALVALFAVCAVAYGAYAVVFNPERSACVKMADLCGAKGGGVDELEQCVTDIKQWRKVGGDEATDKGLLCVQESKTCGEAVGCVAGAGVKGMQGAINEFFKGLGKGMK